MERRRSAPCGERCECKNCRRAGRNTSASGCARRERQTRKVKLETREEEVPMARLCSAQALGTTQDSLLSRSHFSFLPPTFCLLLSSFRFLVSILQFLPSTFLPAPSELYPFVFFSLRRRSNKDVNLLNISTIIVFDKYYNSW